MAPTLAQSPSTFERRALLEARADGNQTVSAAASSSAAAPATTAPVENVANPILGGSNPILGGLTSVVGGVVSSALGGVINPASSSSSTIAAVSAEHSSFSSSFSSTFSFSSSSSSSSTFVQQTQTSLTAADTTPTPTDALTSQSSSTTSSSDASGITTSPDASAIDGSVTQTLTSTDGNSVVTIVTVVPASSSASPSGSAAAASSSSSFLDNKPLSGTIFGVGGLLVLIVIISLVTIGLRKSRRRRLDREEDAAMSVPEMFEQIASEESFHDKRSELDFSVRGNGRRGSAGESEEGLVRRPSDGGDFGQPMQQAYAGYGNRQPVVRGAYPYDAPTVPAAAFQRANPLPTTVPNGSFSPTSGYPVPGPNTIGQAILPSPWDEQRNAPSQANVTRSATQSTKSSSSSPTRYEPPSQMYPSRGGPAGASQQPTWRPSP